jgi:hypothetical protein
MKLRPVVQQTVIAYRKWKWSTPSTCTMSERFA